MSKKTNCRLNRILSRNRFRGAVVAARAAALLLVPLTMAAASLSHLPTLL